MPWGALDGGQGRRGRFVGGEVWFAEWNLRRVGGGGELDALARDWGSKLSEGGMESMSVVRGGGDFSVFGNFEDHQRLIVSKNAFCLP